MKHKLFLIALVSSNAMALDLINGVGITAKVDEALWDTSIPYAIARQGQRSLNENRSVIAFIEHTDFIFSLSSDNYLVKTARADRKVIGSWKLEPFNDPELEPEIISLYQERYNVESHSKTIENTKQFPSGCLISSPLRYGDVTGVNPELAIYAQNQYGAVNITFFSTEFNKVIFQYRAISDDSKENLRKELDEGEAPSDTSPLANHPKDGQFLSVIAEENTPKVVGVGNAIIQFAKIYIEDVDSDEKPDLIQWRKVYQTRENQDPIIGFKKIRDTYIHYKLIDGEYKKQSTEQEIIKGWLADKNLTWQKGYPSKSECPGQEDQLIPEMHDPLLNDPDVLK